MRKKKNKYYIFNKPDNVLSQFTREAGNQSIADYYLLDDKDIYPVGRLDKDSEGLLILTNDKSLNKLILSPKMNKKKYYWALVEGEINKSAIQKLKEGINIKVDKKDFFTKVSLVEVIHEPKRLWRREVPIRERKDIPTTWVNICITEGKNRQVRKMLAKVGFPVLRLIRHRIENLHLRGLQPGDMQEIAKQEFFKKLNLL